MDRVRKPRHACDMLSLLTVWKWRVPPQNEYLPPGRCSNRRLPPGTLASCGPPLQLTDGKTLDREPDLIWHGGKLLIVFSRSVGAKDTNIWLATVIPN